MTATLEKPKRKIGERLAKTLSKKEVLPRQTSKQAPALGSGFVAIETGGKQYLVKSGDIIKVEKLKKEYTKGDTIVFDKVLLWSDEKNISIGTPYVAEKKVEGFFEEAGRSKKVLVIKFKSKVRYKKKYGHRQPYVKVKIR